MTFRIKVENKCEAVMRASVCGVCVWSEKKIKNIFNQIFTALKLWLWKSIGIFWFHAKYIFIAIISLVRHALIVYPTQYIHMYILRTFYAYYAMYLDSYIIYPHALRGSFTNYTYTLPLCIHCPFTLGRVRHVFPDWFNMRYRYIPAYLYYTTILKKPTPFFSSKILTFWFFY